MSQHEGESAEAIDYAVIQFKRIRIAHKVLSDPDERSRLDEEGEIFTGKGDVRQPLSLLHLHSRPFSVALRLACLLAC